ncbi:hypothetical protein J610_1003 [Acinetobacter sp. 723929]|nr:hypothetical protein BJAB0715_03161 [Acinetobacter baumannii BJAB0715]EXI18120.1 hypothetical protein J610_1003 [Acinetobacter sp. 723929]
MIIQLNKGNNMSNQNNPRPPAPPEVPAPQISYEERSIKR